MVCVKKRVKHLSCCVILNNHTIDIVFIIIILYSDCWILHIMRFPTTVATIEAWYIVFISKQHTVEPLFNRHIGPA